MSATDISKRADTIIGESVAPLLKSVGFEKRGRNFYREFSERIEVINIQSSRYNSATEGELTLNLRVYYPETAELSEAVQFKGLPKEYDCTVNTRIGRLMESGKDHLWVLDDRSIDSETASEVLTCTQELVLPWLESMSSFSSVKATLISEKQAFIAAAIALQENNLEEAKSFLELSFTQQPRAAASAKAWGKRHGLIAT